MQIELCWEAGGESIFQRTEFGRGTEQEQFAFIPSLLRGILRTFPLPLQL